MTLRAITADHTNTIRESRRVCTVAAMLDADESQVRRLISAGQLETHRIGKRGVRIYLDSVQAYQQRLARAPTNRHAEKPAQRRRVVTTAAHRQAVAELRAAGLLP